MRVMAYCRAEQIIAPLHQPSDTSGCATDLRDVDLVAQHKERHICKRVVGQQRVQLLLGLRETLPVHGVHQEHDGVHLQQMLIA